MRLSFAFRTLAVVPILLCVVAADLIGQETSTDVPTEAKISGEGSPKFPQVTDSRLELTLFAEDPQIVTPIGMVIDDRNQVFVIESHTHHPPSDYSGPDSDRIKIFVDEDDDGKADAISIFAEGVHQAMNLALSPDGVLYVICAREVLRLPDRDEDGVCDGAERVLVLETEQRYAHNSLLGITFDRDGWMYVSRGNTGSDYYRFKGSDESFVEGYGDGGNVVRCRPDGQFLEEVATGFWNPFDLKFDRSGRLLLVDNDPDARGPNRLVHVVSGGDYGYKSMYGGSGNHPFQGWDGTLPGTLPYIAGTGEAPSGLIDCRRSDLPLEYKKSILATIWNENSIERFEIEEGAGTVHLKKKSLLMTGPKDFRPVAIDCDQRGNIFVTDWVLVNYPNHGRGRIWRISNPNEKRKLKPQSYFSEYESDPTQTRRDRLQNSTVPRQLMGAVVNGDPFEQHAARKRLTQLEPLRTMLSRHANPKLRLQGLLAQKKSKTAIADSVRPYLQDFDPNVRQAALMWAGESMLAELRPDLDIALRSGPVDAVVFETYLAAAENLNPNFLADFASRKHSKSNKIPRSLDPQLLVELAHDEELPETVRRLAISRFDDEVVREQLPWLVERINGESLELAIAAIRRAASLTDAPDQLIETLTATALDKSFVTPLRCECLLALASRSVSDPKAYLPLLRDEEESVAIEAARTIRSWLDADPQLDITTELRESELPEPVIERLAEARQRKLFREAPQRPASLEDWQEFSTDRGDPNRGRRVFFTGRIGCTKCHSIDGSGGILGPDLSRVAQSKSPEQIIHSILKPSAEFPPQYQAWLVATTDGKVHRGLQLDHKSGGDIVLTLESGENRKFAANEIEDYIASPKSLMPDGLVETMSVGEFRDLIAFLASLK